VRNKIDDSAFGPLDHGACLLVSGVSVRHIKVYDIAEVRKYWLLSFVVATV